MKSLVLATDAQSGVGAGG